MIASYPAGWPDPWSSWNIDRTPSGSAFSNTFDNVVVTITAVNYESILPQSRDRGNQSYDQYLGYVHRDFLYVSHSTSVGLGWDGFKLEFSGLNANTEYEFTFWNYDDAHGGTVEDKFMCWGIADPTSYPNYQPAEDPTAPYLARVRMAGNWPADPIVSDPYFYSGSINVTTDASGNATIYGWTDLDSWTGNQHGMINGFAVGFQPCLIHRFRYNLSHLLRIAASRIINHYTFRHLYSFLFITSLKNYILTNVL